MSYQPIQLNATDSQMLESRQFNVQDIARFFGISPVLLGDLSHNSYSTIEAVQEQFLLQTLQPYITMIEEEFTKKLFKENESDLEINLDETVILRTNKTAQASYYSTLLDKGILSINEVRKELGYSEIEGGDAHTIAYTDINQNKIDDGKQESGN
jgi:HK97 family phage portal protein